MSSTGAQRPNTIAEFAEFLKILYEDAVRCPEQYVSVGCKVPPALEHQAADIAALLPQFRVRIRREPTGIYADIIMTGRK